MKKVLSIAGSDSSGGAGIQADIKTMIAHGSYAMTVITVLTAQNTTGVYGISEVAPEFVENQLDCVFTDIFPDAVKIGMVYNAAIIHSIAGKLKQYQARNIVLDPVMVATSGDKLLQDEAIDTLKEELIPFVRVITPNIHEAEILLGKKIHSQDELPLVIRDLSFGRAVSVLLKAGHLTDDLLTDVFYNAETDEIITLPSKRIDTRNTHGTGCTFSAAIAAFLAHGLSLSEAVRKAKEYMTGAILSGSEYEIGKGYGPVHHFFGYW